MIAVAALFVGANARALGFALLSYAFGCLLAIFLILRGYPHSLIGTSNLITQVRMAVVPALLAPDLANKTSWLLVLLPVAVSVLDGFDGRLARSEGTVSHLGAPLEVDVDSIPSLVLALNVWAAGLTGPWVLFFALPRYLFIAAAAFLPWLEK